MKKNASQTSLLCGTHEAAEILRVSKQRIGQLRSDPRFPDPLAELACGPIWNRTVIEEFARLERPTGRPPSGSPLTPPAVREQAAREQIEYHRERMAEMAAIRGQAVRDLKVQLRTWEAVGEAIGTSGQVAHKLAQRGKE